MGPVSGLVLFAVVWFMVLFVVLPMNITTQGEAQDVVRGTPKSAPMDPKLKRKVWIVTAATIPLWVVSCAIIISGWITLDDMSFFERARPPL